MNRLQLFRLLRRNNQLSVRRSPAFEQNMVAKVLMLLGAAFAAIYLIFFGVMFGTMANETDSPNIVFLILPLLLLFDFGARFGMQQTPAMLMKPYMLLPLPRHSVIETFLMSSTFSGWNMLWLCLFLPFAVITLAGGMSFLTVLTAVVSGMLFVMFNSQWYLFVRTMVARSLLWWALPAVFYTTYFLPMLLDDKLPLFSKMADFVVEDVPPVVFLVLSLLLLAGMLAINRATQFRFVFEEISREEKQEGSMKRVSEFSFLERYGQAGEYLKLEVKSIMRNKAIRARVVMSLALVVMLVALISFTDMYDGFLILNFWCYYCFSIYGLTALVKVMGAEGNYIDLLMSHRENILSLLKAKYYFHVAILLVPLLLTIPAVVAGKFSVLMVVAYTLLTSGVTYFMMFQLGVNNKQTLPLNKKITGKNNVENGIQLLVEMLAMIAPLIIVAVLLILFNETVAYIVIAVIGLAFTLAHPWWLRNIYLRMMARKYENLEGFHASR